MTKIDRIIEHLEDKAEHADTMLNMSTKIHDIEHWDTVKVTCINIRNFIKRLGDYYND